jgi:hypothetical protein
MNLNSLQSITSANLIDIIMPNKEDKLMRFFNQMLLYNYSPDLTGYTLLFFVPPHLSGLSVPQKDPETGENVSGYDFNNSSNYSPVSGKYVDKMLDDVSRFITFAAIDFTAPQETLNTEKISSRSGAIPYATEFTTSEQLSVTYIDDADLTIYKFHQIWMHYIWDVLEGRLSPSWEYLTPRPDMGYGSTGGIYHGIDYAASMYIVKYKPNMNKITYIGKCIGVFPQSLPSKELIGQRTTNELTTLPFSYLCAAYRAEVVSQINDVTTAITDKAFSEKYWILTEFYKHILTKF